MYREVHKRKMAVSYTHLDVYKRQARHVVVNHFSVDSEVLEADVLHFPFFVVAGNDG